MGGLQRDIRCAQYRLSHMTQARLRGRGRHARTIAHAHVRRPNRVETLQVGVHGDVEFLLACAKPHAATIRRDERRPFGIVYNVVVFPENEF
jgi:hypothetical protein